MIDEHDLMELSGKFRDIRQLERDYLLILLLQLRSNFQIVRKWIYDIG